MQNIKFHIITNNIRTKIQSIIPNLREVEQSSNNTVVWRFVTKQGFSIMIYLNQNSQTELMKFELVSGLTMINRDKSNDLLLFLLDTSRSFKYPLRFSLSESDVLLLESSLNPDHVSAEYLMKLIHFTILYSVEVNKVLENQYGLKPLFGKNEENEVVYQ